MQFCLSPTTTCRGPSVKNVLDMIPFNYHDGVAATHERLFSKGNHDTVTANMLGIEGLKTGWSHLLTCKTVRASCLRNAQNNVLRCAG
jgi:hypothetical protein